MQIGIPRETAPGERRVAMVPDNGARLIKIGHDLAIQSGAGLSANHDDASYVARGATTVGNVDDLYGSSALICKVQAPSVEEAEKLREGTTVVSFLQPGAHLDLVEVLIRRGVTSFSLDLLPRISRGQSMDALSSQATVTGYAAAIVAASRLPKFFPMFMTAAGTIPPAKVLIMGAGVAGLQAISTARRLGAVVRAYDVRSAAKEEVQSLGATFVELELETQEGEGGYAKEQSEEFLRRQRELITKEVAVSDVVITTAAIPGRRAPILVTAEMVAAMASGTVIVDLAAESGGNCELSQAGEEIESNGVLIYGAKDLASTMAVHASLLYSRNVAEFVGLIAPKGDLELNFDDEIIAGTCITHAGEVRHAPTRELIEASR